MLIVEHLSHQFNRSDPPVAALDNITLTVAPGEFVCVVGPSGCGKTTLLRILAGLLTPGKGRVLLDGQPIRGPQRRIGLVFQRANLMPWLTVRANLALPLDLAGVARAEREYRIARMLEMLGLAAFGEAFPAALSGGMAQRVAIGRALIQDPDILLLDEPFGALDALTREQMQLELLRLWANAAKTVMMVTHSINEAVFVADRIIVLTPRPGRIGAEVSIALPRPRRLDMMHEPMFGSLARQVRQAIENGA